MKIRFLALALVIAVLGSTLVAPLTAGAQSTSPFSGIPVSVSNTLGSFVGTATINRFAVQGGQLVAIGTITGTVTTFATGATQTLTQNFVAPVTNLNGSCQILDLDVGAIHLDLLGLVVDLAPIHLDITAQPGAGNLLGNLLCSIASLLDQSPTAALQRSLAQLLNQVLNILR